MPDDVAVAEGGTSAREADDIYTHGGDPGRIAAALQQCSRIWLAGYATGSDWQPVPSHGADALQSIGDPVTFGDQAVAFGGFELQLVRQQNPPQCGEPR